MNKLTTTAIAGMMAFGVASQANAVGLVGQDYEDTNIYNNYTEFYLDVFGMTQTQMMEEFYDTHKRLQWNRAKLAETKGQLAYYKVQYAKAVKDLNTQTATINALTDDVADLEATVAELNANVAALETQVADFEAHNAELEAHLDTAGDFGLTIEGLDAWKQTVEAETVTSKATVWSSFAQMENNMIAGEIGVYNGGHFIMDSQNVLLNLSFEEGIEKGLFKNDDAVEGDIISTIFNGDERRAIFMDGEWRTFASFNVEVDATVAELHDAIGFQRGYDKGYELGYFTGDEDGFDRGFDEGHESGLTSHVVNDDDFKSKFESDFQNYSGQQVIWTGTKWKGATVGYFPWFGWVKSTEVPLWSGNYRNYLGTFAKKVAEGDLVTLWGTDYVKIDGALREAGIFDDEAYKNKNWDDVVSDGGIRNSKEVKDVFDIDHDENVTWARFDGDVSVNFAYWIDGNKTTVNLDKEGLNDLIDAVAEESWEEGYTEGYEDGYGDGWNDGYATGYADGVSNNDPSLN